VKVHGHWQSDVIAGFALGSATGYVMHKRKGSPLILSVMPHGIFVGLEHEF
jgi:undecaprenyl-diphosphatase